MKGTSSRTGIAVWQTLNAYSRLSKIEAQMKNLAATPFCKDANSIRIGRNSSQKLLKVGSFSKDNHDGKEETVSNISSRILPKNEKESSKASNTNHKNLKKGKTSRISSDFLERVTQTRNLKNGTPTPTADGVAQESDRTHRLPSNLGRKRVPDDVRIKSLSSLAYDAVKG